MNKNNFENFIENLSQVGKQANLNPRKKDEFRHILLRHLADNPARDRNRHQEKIPVLSFISNFFAKPMYKSAILALLMLFGGVGTTLAANQSMPDETLYPVKINFNEKIKTLLAISDEADADARLELMNRRMDEGVSLASKGTLDSETQAKLDNLINKYQAEIEQIVADSDMDEKMKLGLLTSISARIQAIIQVHEKALDKFQDDEDNVQFRSNLKNKLAKLDNEEKEFVGTVVPEEEDAKQFESAAENKINAAAKILENVKKFLEKKSDSANKEVSVAALASAETQLNLAKAKLETARTQNSAKDFKDAFVTANQAIRLAQQAKAIISVGEHSNVDVNMNSNEQKGSDNEKDNKDEVRDRSIEKDERESERVSENETADEDKVETEDKDENEDSKIDDSEDRNENSFESDRNSDQRRD